MPSRPRGISPRALVAAGAGDPCGGLEVCLVLDAIPAGADPGRSWRPSRSLDPGRLGEADSVVAEGALRAPAASHSRGAIVLLRRDADAGARSRKGPHQNLPVLGPCGR